MPFLILDVQQEQHILAKITQLHVVYYETNDPLVWLRIQKHKELLLENQQLKNELSPA